MRSYEDLEIKTTGKYLKIDPSEAHDIRLLSEFPHVRMIHGFGKEAQECAGDHCTNCAGGIEAKQRFYVNVYDHNTKKVLVWEFGAMIAKQLKKIAVTLKEEGRIMLETDLKVEAEGADKNRKYTLTPRMAAKPVPTGLVLHKLDLPF